MSELFSEELNTLFFDDRADYESLVNIIMDFLFQLYPGQVEKHIMNLKWTIVTCKQ